MHQISEMANQLGNQFSKVIIEYFEAFQLRMHARERVSSTIVDSYKDDVCFLVSTNHCIIQAVEPRTGYVPELKYKITSKTAKAYADALTKANLDLSAYRFGCYEEIQDNFKKRAPIKNVYTKRTPTPKKKLVTEQPKDQRKRVQPVPSTQGEEQEETKTEETIPLVRKRTSSKPLKQDPPRRRKPTIDEFVVGLKDTSGMSSVNTRYQFANEEDRRKIEEAVVYCIHKFNLHPTKLHRVVPDLLQILEARWKALMDREKELRI